MNACWRFEPAKRLNFIQINKYLHTIQKQNSEHEEYFDLTLMEGGNSRQQRSYAARPVYTDHTDGQKSSKSNQIRTEKVSAIPAYAGTTVVKQPTFKDALLNNDGQSMERKDPLSSERRELRNYATSLVPKQSAEAEKMTGEYAVIPSFLSSQPQRHLSSFDSECVILDELIPLTASLGTPPPENATPTSLTLSAEAGEETGGYAAVPSWISSELRKPFSSCDSEEGILDAS